MTSWMDILRQGIGYSLDVAGLGPRETPYRAVIEAPGARLRAYHEQKTSGPVIFIIPAPFKRPYIWDILPEVSVVLRFLSRGFRVYLVEWLAPTKEEDELSLFDYASRIPLACIEAIDREAGSVPPILAGHSIGGTFAAIFATLFPERVGGLILVDAPLVFGEHGGPLGCAVRQLPDARLIRLIFGSPVPGSLISALCTIAAPEIFAGQRHYDLISCLFDTEALDMHARIERWTYDEFPMAGRLFEEIVELLYRQNAFVKGTLRLEDRCASLVNLRSRVVAVANVAGKIVPPPSLIEGLRIAKNAHVELLHFGWQRGAVLQHLGPLVTPEAHAQLWPRILAWAGEAERKSD